MTIQLKQLTYERIDRSPEIQAWLEPFGVDRTVAIEMLLRLRFVPRDTYAEWLKATIEDVRAEKTALFAVRKFGSEVKSVWNEQGQYGFRPPESLGSEDLVQSVIANLAKGNEDSVFDHPDLAMLRKHQVHQLILIDDSIGSGKRVRDFLRRLFRHKTILSWWSYAKLKVVIVAFVRIDESVPKILDGVPGSDHGLRKHPKNQKVRVVSHLVYPKNCLHERWGASHERILQLCNEEMRVPKPRRRGFGRIMANIVFYHSVPNNLPGVLWHQSDDWNGLFPERNLPVWLPLLLESQGSLGGEPSVAVNGDAIEIIRLAKRGVRNDERIAWHLGLDRNVIRRLLTRIQKQGLLTHQNRITEAGRTLLANQNGPLEYEFNQSLYIPQKWCADREPVQPFGVERESVLLQTESDVGSLTSDGEVGQASLEKTDAKTASPSLGIMPELPSRPRDGHDAHGPSGPKES